MPGTDVAKISAGHRETHLLAVSFCRLDVTRKIVHNLCKQTRPVDGIDGTNLVLAFEGQIVADCLDDVLAIIKHTFDGNVENIGVHQAEHLRLLKRTHASERTGHEDPHTLLAAHGVLGGAAGIATGGTQDVQFLATSGQFVLEQIAEQLHGHVLEGQGGAVGQALQPEPLFEVAQRNNFSSAKYGCCIGLLAQRTQVCSRNVVDVQRQNLEGQLCITLAVVDTAPAGQGGIVDLRIRLRQVQTPVGCQTFKKDFTKALAIRVATRRQVPHANSSLRIRVIGASTVDKACICAMAAFILASTQSCVRMMRSV